MHCSIPFQQASPTLGCKWGVPVLRYTEHY
jgi:hypothetical protein